jgi:hypothetical protein
LLVFAGIRKFGPLSDLENGLVVGATFGLSWLTFMLLERPIRRSGSFAIPLLGCMAGLAFVTQVPLFGYEPRLPDAIARLVTPPPNGVGWRVGECMLLETDAVEFGPGCTDRKRPLIAIWGDSTASALIPGFRKLQESHDFGLAQYTVSSCPPVLLRPTPVKHCLERNREIVDLLSSAAPDIVILHAIWDVNDQAEDLRPTIEALRSRHIARIVILGPVPVWPGGLPNAAAAYFWRTRDVIPERTRFFFDRASGDELLRKISAELNVEYISARSIFCSSDGCIARIGNSLSASDILHLTAAGSNLLANSIWQQLGISQP